MTRGCGQRLSLSPAALPHAQAVVLGAASGLLHVALLSSCLHCHALKHTHAVHLQRKDITSDVQEHLHTTNTRGEV